jgi:transposase
MMGRQNRDQEQLFYSFCLDEAVPADHHVRAIAAVLDLSWVHAALTSYYPRIGRPSIDPVLMIRMLIVGYVFAIRSERALCREVQVNFAYRWFCGLSIEDKVPDHSAFSRARNERFSDSAIFRSVFERVVGTCIAAGLVGGEGFAVDASLIEADANKHRSIRAHSGTRILIRSRRGARSKSIWQRSTIRPTAQLVMSRRSLFHHPILPPSRLVFLHSPEPSRSFQSLQQETIVQLQQASLQAALAHRECIQSVEGLQTHRNALRQAGA